MRTVCALNTPLPSDTYTTINKHPETIQATAIKASKPYGRMDPQTPVQAVLCSLRSLRCDIL